MNILIICTHGKNRSVVLQKFLLEKGYESITAGIRDDAGDLKEKIHVADVIISVHPEIEKQIRERFNVSGKRIISLNVEDRPEYVLPEGKPLSGQEWIDFQKKYVRNKLTEQLEKYLPL